MPKETPVNDQDSGLLRLREIVSDLREAWVEVAIAIPDPGRIVITPGPTGWRASIKLNEATDITAVAATAAEALTALAEAYGSGGNTGGPSNLSDSIGGVVLRKKDE